MSEPGRHPAPSPAVESGDAPGQETPTPPAADEVAGLREQLEAVLMVVDEPVTVAQLTQATGAESTQVGEILSALADDPSLTVLAGGTDLMVDLNYGRRVDGRPVGPGAASSCASWPAAGASTPGPPTPTWWSGSSSRARPRGSHRPRWRPWPWSPTSSR